MPDELESQSLTVSDAELSGAGQHRPAGVDYLIAGLLAILLFGAFYSSPTEQVSDSHYTLLLSEHLLMHQQFQLDAYFEPWADSRRYPGVRVSRWPRQVQPLGVRQGEAKGIEGPLYYVYPPGTSILSIPVVALARLVGVSLIEPGNQFVWSTEMQLQRLTAAGLMGFAVGLFFLLARYFASVRWSLAIALWGGLATPIWSTGSRALWSHTWEVVLLALALLSLLRVGGRRAPLSSLWLGTLLSWAFWVRPTAVFYIVPITLLVAMRHRRRLLPLVATGAFWLATFVAYSWHHFGRWLPDYYHEGQLFSFDTWGIGFLAQLVAPSRGLLVYVPMLVLIAAGLVICRRRLRDRHLVNVAIAAVAAQVVVTAGFRNYWGGACYGPRFYTGLVPLFVILAAIALNAWQDTAVGLLHQRSRRVVLLAVAVLFAVGVSIHGAAAVSTRGVLWNKAPSLRKDPTRIFDWRQPQWACALSSRWCPAELDALQPTRRGRW